MGQRAAGSDDRHVGICQDVLACAKFNTGKIERILLQRPGIFFIKAVETNVIVKQKSRIVGKDLLYPAALELNGFSGVIVDPRFAQKERMPDRSR